MCGASRCTGDLRGLVDPMMAVDGQTMMCTGALMATEHDSALAVAITTVVSGAPDIDGQAPQRGPQRRLECKSSSAGIRSDPGIQYKLHQDRQSQPGSRAGMHGVGGPKIDLTSQKLGLDIHQRPQLGTPRALKSSPSLQTAEF